MNLSDKRVLVTGGAVRIGRAICLELARRGAYVIVHYNRSGIAAGELVREIMNAGGNAAAVQAELRDAASCRRLIADASAISGGLDCLVNNASVFRKQPLLRFSEQELEDEMRINAYVPLFLTQTFAGQYSSESVGGRSAGRIVNLLDRRVAGNESGAVPYMLSKKILAEFTRLAALELAPYFTVNAVAPGPVLPPPGKGDDYVAEAAGNIPMEVRPTVRQVADAVAFLLEADSVTGQTVFVDGGQHLL